jgi:hypothetical protein
MSVRLGDPQFDLRKAHGTKQTQLKSIFGVCDEDVCYFICLARNVILQDQNGLYSRNKCYIILSSSGILRRLVRM